MPSSISISKEERQLLTSITSNAKGPFNIPKVAKVLPEILDVSSFLLNIPSEKKLVDDLPSPSESTSTVSESKPSLDLISNSSNKASSIENVFNQFKTMFFRFISGPPPTTQKERLTSLEEHISMTEIITKSKTTISESVSGLLNSLTHHTITILKQGLSLVDPKDKIALEKQISHVENAEHNQKTSQELRNIQVEMENGLSVDFSTKKLKFGKTTIPGKTITIITLFKVKGVSLSHFKVLQKLSMQFALASTLFQQKKYVQSQKLFEELLNEPKFLEIDPFLCGKVNIKIYECLRGLHKNVSARKYFDHGLQILSHILHPLHPEWLNLYHHMGQIGSLSISQYPLFLLNSTINLGALHINTLNVFSVFILNSKSPRLFEKYSLLHKKAQEIYPPSSSHYLELQVMWFSLLSIFSPNSEELQNQAYLILNYLYSFKDHQQNSLDDRMIINFFYTNAFLNKAYHFIAYSRQVWFDCVTTLVQNVNELSFSIDDFFRIFAPLFHLDFTRPSPDASFDIHKLFGQLLENFPSYKTELPGLVYTSNMQKFYQGCKEIENEKAPTSWGNIIESGSFQSDLGNLDIYGKFFNACWDEKSIIKVDQFVESLVENQSIFEDINVVESLKGHITIYQGNMTILRENISKSDFKLLMPLFTQFSSKLRFANNLISLLIHLKTSQSLPIFPSFSTQFLPNLIEEKLRCIFFVDWSEI